MHGRKEARMKTQRCADCGHTQLRHRDGAGPCRILLPPVRSGAAR
jgi:hypothetical protein